MVFTLTILSRSTGAPVSGANVIFTRLSDGLQLSGVSDAEGVARVYHLPPVAFDEVYTVVVGKAGFAPYVMENASFGEGDSTTVRLDVEVEPPDETWIFVENYRGYDITTKDGRYSFTHGSMVYNIESLVACRMTIDSVLVAPPAKVSVLDKFVGFKDHSSIERIILAGGVLGLMVSLAKSSFPKKEIRDLKDER